MKKSIFVLCLGLAVGVLTFGAMVNNNSSEVLGEFSNEVAMLSYSTSGDMMTNVSDAELYDSFVADNVVSYGRSTGCSTGCSVGCSTGCSVGCSSGCSVGCSSGCSYGCKKKW